MTKTPTATAKKRSYRVSYVEGVLREAYINAESAEAAEEVVRSQMENAAHHHAVDAWTDDWQAEPHAKDPSSRRTRCFECGA